MEVASLGPDPHHPVHRRCALAAESFSVGGSYRHVVNGGSCATVPTLQAQTAYIRHQARTSSPTELLGGVPIRAKGLVQGPASEGLHSCSGPPD